MNTLILVTIIVTLTVYLYKLLRKIKAEQFKWDINYTPAIATMIADEYKLERARRQTRYTK